MGHIIDDQRSRGCCTGKFRGFSATPSQAWPARAPALPLAPAPAQEQKAAPRKPLFPPLKSETPSPSRNYFTGSSLCDTCTLIHSHTSIHTLSVARLLFFRQHPSPQIEISIPYKRQLIPASPETLAVSTEYLKSRISIHSISEDQQNIFITHADIDLLCQ